MKNKFTNHIYDMYPNAKPYDIEWSWNIVNSVWDERYIISNKNERELMEMKDWWVLNMAVAEYEMLFTEMSEKYVGEVSEKIAELERLIP